MTQCSLVIKDYLQSGLYPKDSIERIRFSDHYELQISTEFEEARVSRFRHLLDKYAVQFKIIPMHSQPESMKAGQCFKNASLVALSNGDIVYCEGVILGKCQVTGRSVSMIHAWCYYPKFGIIFDPTCHPTSPDFNAVYVGIPFSSVYVARKAKEYGYYGLLDGSKTEEYHGVDEDPEHHWLHPCWSSLPRYHGNF